MKLLYPTIEPHLSSTSPKLDVVFLIRAKRPSLQSITFLKPIEITLLKSNHSLLDAKNTPLKKPEKYKQKLQN